MYEYKTLSTLTKELDVKHLPSPTKIFAALNRKRHEFFERQMKDKTSAIYRAVASGRRIHEALEKDTARDAFERAVLRRFKKDIGVDIDETWAKEMGLVSLKKRFRGKFDGIGIFRGQQTVWDYKKVNKLKSPSQIRDYVKQCAAYAVAHDEMYGTEISQLAVMMIGGKTTEELSTRVFVVEGRDLRAAKREFLGDVKKFELMM